MLSMEGFFLDEKIKEIIDQYHVEVYNTYRGRGAFICETNEGLKLVREYSLSPNRLVFESMVKYTIRDRGYLNVDQIVVNQNGQLFSQNRSERNYVMKDWFEGHECDLKKREDVMESARNLARLHKSMRKVRIDGSYQGNYFYGGMGEQFAKHNREMKSIRNYMRSKRQKNAFELLYLSHFDYFYHQAQSSIMLLEGSAYKELLAEAVWDKTLCHGDYNQHNIIINKDRTATVNFDKMNINIQMNDLYLFLRKAMEKNHWDYDLGFAIIDAYREECMISSRELEYLFILLMYPEKFWKIANHYYNMRKSWTSGRNQEKLEMFVEHRGERERFLELCYQKL